ARRLIEQGGVSINGERVTDLNTAIPQDKAFVVKVGKRKFLRIIQA
ncbi:tyrosine--tRNA ligase, partial [bacterium]